MLLGQRRVRHRTQQKPYVSLLQGQRRHDLGRMQGFDRDGNIGVLDAKQLDRVRQDFVAQGQHCQYAQLFDTTARLEVGGQALHFIELGKQAFNMRVEGQRFGCRYKPPLAALKQ